MNQHPPGSKRGRHANALYKLIRDCSPFRSSRGSVFVHVPATPFVSDVLGVRSTEFREWIVARFVSEFDAFPSPSSVLNAIRAAEAIATPQGFHDHDPAARLVASQDKIVLDLANPERECVEITPDGWHLTESNTYAFQRGALTQPLPAPEKNNPGALNQFRTFLNLQSAPDWTRLLVWLSAALHPNAPAPILVLQGPSGSGKTTTARLLRALLDPLSAFLTRLPGGPTAIRKQAHQSRILAFDQVDRIPVNLANELCEIADMRHLPIILVRSAASKTPLPENVLTRAITLTLQPLESCATLEDLREEFEALRPAILAALCTVTATALERRPSYKGRRFPRLADTTAWALAATPSLDLTEAEILASLQLSTVGRALPPANSLPDSETRPSRSAKLDPIPPVPELPNNLLLAKL